MVLVRHVFALVRPFRPNVPVVSFTALQNQSAGTSRRSLDADSERHQFS